MKNTIFGAIIAAFLIMSVSFIVPVQVQATEGNIEETKQDLGELAIAITEHESFNDLKNNEDLMAIVEDLLESGVTEEKVLEYWNAIKDLDAFKNICSDHIINKAESIKDSIDSILSDDSDPIEQGDNGFYITIDEENKLSISEESKENSIFLSKNGAIKLPGHETIDSDIMDNVKDFLIMLFLGGLAAAVGVLIVAGVFFLLQTIVAAIATGLGSIVSVVVIVAAIFAGIAVVSAVATFIIDLIEFFTDSKDSEDKSKSADTKNRTKLISKVRNFLNKVFALFNMKIQNVFS